MPRIARIQFPGAFYHVLSRGIERRSIYRSVRDRQRFLEILQEAQERYQIKVYGYCLMSNHYHLLLETPEGNLSRVMKYVNGSYATYFNAKWKRVGHIFSYRYKSIVVEEDRYLMILSRYIHLNPTRAKMVEMPGDYRWSSYREYLNLRKSKWLDTDWVLQIFSSKSKLEAMQRYKQFVEQGMDGKVQDPFKRSIRGSILGSDEFVERITGGNQEWNDIKRENVIEKPTINEIEKCVESLDTLDAKNKRKIAVYLYRQYTDETYEAIGEKLGGISRQGVYKMVQQFSSELKKDKKLADEVGNLIAKIKH